MQVRINGLVKRFEKQTVLHSISLEIRDHELFFLLGPSGCGKTTLLRSIAGFYQPDEGELFFGDRLMNGVPPHKRNAGMVFQNYALWPHLSVAENVAYGLEVRDVDARERKQRVAEALAIVRMEPFADRSPAQLSGGQQQRVALARALVIRPDVLLLDEPLSNLDAKLRLEMRDEIRRIHDETQITTIYVTHDQKEALSLATRMAVLREGRIEQIGEPRDVYRTPNSRFVADFMGETNWLDAKVLATSKGMVQLETSCGVWWCSQGAATWQAGAKVQMGFRPESVRVDVPVGTGDGALNEFVAKVRQVTYLGEIEQYWLELGGGVTLKAFEQDPAAIRQKGSEMRLKVDPKNILLMPA